MSYTKHAWVTGETITAEKLNNIEDGVDDVTRQLSDLDDDKQDAPSTAGTAGQVLALDDNLNPVWANQSGGGGGTTDYAQLSNKPTINNVELSGNKTLAELGINAGSVGFDETGTYADGSIGAEVSAQKNAISQKEDALSIVQKTSSDVTITLEEDKFYIFPTMTELTVTCPLTGLYGFRFTSGTTPTVFLMSGITMPDNWNGTEASKTYDMTILNGLALVTSWSV